MPSLKEIRKRITSVKNTQKITKAMKLVAAAKLRRAQETIVAARPYATALEKVVFELVSDAQEETHPLLQQRSGTKAQILLLTSDRGLAGSFNAQIIRQVENFVEEELNQYQDVSLVTVGRKGSEYFSRRNANVHAQRPAPTSADALDKSRELAHQITDDFSTANVDRVYLAYNEFKSAITQTVTIHQLLPITPGPSKETDRASCLYEPSKQSLLDHLLPLYVQISIYRATLESIAAELGARMSAMDSATRNAGEMIDKLTLEFNRARQAAITKELLEIISGAEALKG